MRKSQKLAEIDFFENWSFLKILDFFEESRKNQEFSKMTNFQKNRSQQVFEIFA